MISFWPREGVPEHEGTDMIQAYWEWLTMDKMQVYVILCLLNIYTTFQRISRSFYCSSHKGFQSLGPGENKIWAKTIGCHKDKASCALSLICSCLSSCNGRSSMNINLNTSRTPSSESFAPPAALKQSTKGRKRVKCNRQTHARCFDRQMNARICSLFTEDHTGTSMKHRRQALNTYDCKF